MVVACGKMDTQKQQQQPEASHFSSKIRHLKEKLDAAGVSAHQQTELISFITTEIPRIRLFVPDGKPEKDWRLFHGDTHHSAYDAAHEAAVSAKTAHTKKLKSVHPEFFEWSKQIESIMWIAAYKGGPEFKVKFAALEAAQTAAWDTVMTHLPLDRTNNFATDAVMKDIKLLAGLLAIRRDDPNLPKDIEKYVEHARSRVRVWQKGYGLVCDVFGTLYVFSHDKPSKHPADLRR